MDVRGPTACFSGGLPREPTDETENVFERKKALKRNVATRQPARHVGKLLTCITFAKPLENNLRQPTKLTAKAGLNKAWAEEHNKMAFQILQLFERKKLIARNLLAITG